MFPKKKTFHFVKISLLLHLPLSLSTLSLQFVSNGIEQSDPAQPSMQTHLYSPSSKVHCPLREQPFSHPAAASDVRKEEKSTIYEFSAIFFVSSWHMRAKRGEIWFFHAINYVWRLINHIRPYYSYHISGIACQCIRLICWYAQHKKKVYIYVIFFLRKVAWHRVTHKFIAY